MTLQAWAFALLAVFFAIGCVYLYMAADDAERRERGMRERLRLQDLQIAYYRQQAARRQVERMAWPEQVKDVWTRTHPN